MTSGYSTKVAVIGAGKWGLNHIRTLNEMGTLAAVVEANPVTQKKIKEAYPDIPCFDSLETPGAMEYQAYSVVVPAKHHFSVAKHLLANNKHVLVEKPLTLVSKESESLINLASQKNKILMVGHLLLFHPAFKKMKQLIDENKIGKLQYIYSNRLNLGTVRTEENSLWSFAPHDISLFNFLTQDFPEKVSSNGGAFLQAGIHDTTITSLAYKNNISGHIFVSWLHPFKEHRFVVIGSKGMLVFEDSSQDKELLFYKKGIDVINGEPVKREGVTEKIPYENKMPLKEELAHFIACIEKKEDNVIISAEAGRDVIKILELAQDDLTNKSPISSENSKPEAGQRIHEFAIVDESAQIGSNTRVWQFSNIQAGVSIGENCRIGQNVSIGSNVKIGNGVKIQNNVSVYEGVELEDYVFCGPSMVFTNVLNPRSKYPQAESNLYKKTLVKEGASIGANATIVCGITIGKHAFIGAGAVVTKNVPDYALLIGNPAKIAGWYSEGGEKLEFDAGNIATCKKSKKAYKLENNRVKEI